MASFFKRLITQITGAANDALDAGSDNSRTIRQSIREMQEDIGKATAAVAEVKAQKAIVANKLSIAEQAVASWGERAARAVERGEDELASAALAQQVAEEHVISMYRSQLTELTAQIAKLDDRLSARKSELEQAKIDGGIMQANDAVATATMTAAETLSDNGGAASIAAAKEAIDLRAAKADAMLEMTEDKGIAIERRLRELETNNTVADRLAALKAKTSK